MTVVGVNMTAGERIEGRAHLRRSIRDILTTPIGTRVMRRDYGSDLFSLIDNTINGVTLVRIYAATVKALRKWEPRLRVTRVRAVPTTEEIGQGHIELELEGEYLPEGRAIRMEGLVI